MAVRSAPVAPIPVYVARGLHGATALARLRADAGVRVVASPRHATVLVVVGAVPRAHLDALANLHDQVPAPRGVATLDVAGDAAALGLGADLVRLPADDPVPALRSLHADVVAGVATHPVLGSSDNPTPWKGVGPHGQGGEGMMGGMPYGRMMPMPPTEGRDGLALDRLSLRLGPFLPGWPSGVVADVGLQGDVIEEVALVPADAGDTLVGGPIRPPEGPDGEATVRLVALAELCAVAGLGALARRTARFALRPDRAGIARLRRRLDRPWGLRAATDGVGRLPDVTDVTDRWRGWLDDADALLAGHAAPRRAARDPDAIADALRGQEVGRAWLTLASLQPDLEPRLPAAAPAAP